MRILALVLGAILLAAGPVSANTCGEFTPMIGQMQANGHYEDESPFHLVHYFAKNCNKVTIAGVDQTIPPGVGVVSGGVSADIRSACIDKVCGQPLAVNTTYRVYVYCATQNPCAMTMGFSTAGHMEDPTYGNEVNVNDPGQSLVGMVHTNDAGLVDGDTGRQMTISWFNRGHTGLGHFIGIFQNPPNPLHVCPSASTPSNPSWAETGISIEFLTFGINNTFQQAFTVPNVYFSGMVANDQANSISAVGIAFGATSAPFSGQPWAFQANPSAGYFVQDIAIGAGGANEGYVKARLVVSNLGYGGCVQVIRGTLYASPLHS